MVRGRRNARLLNQLGNATALTFASRCFDEDIPPRRAHRCNLLTNRRQFVDATDKALKPQIEQAITFALLRRMPNPRQRFFLFECRK